VHYRQWKVLFDDTAAAVSAQACMYL